MLQELRKVKTGLALVFLGLIFGVGMGISFGVNEDACKSYISSEIQAHPEVHDEKSEGKIWRYEQRAHFHAAGIAAFSMGLIILVMVSGMKSNMKKVSSFLIGLSGFLSTILVHDVLSCPFPRQGSSASPLSDRGIYLHWGWWLVAGYAYANRKPVFLTVQGVDEHMNHHSHVCMHISARTLGKVFQYG